MTAKSIVLWAVVVAIWLVGVGNLVACLIVLAFLINDFLAAVTTMGLNKVDRRRLMSADWNRPLLWWVGTSVIPVILSVPVGVVCTAVRLLG